MADGKFTEWQLWCRNCCTVLKRHLDVVNYGEKYICPKCGEETRVPHPYEGAEYEARKEIASWLSYAFKTYSGAAKKTRRQALTAALLSGCGNAHTVEVAASFLSDAWDKNSSDYTDRKFFRKMKSEMNVPDSDCGEGSFADASSARRLFWAYDFFCSRQAAERDAARFVDKPDLQWMFPAQELLTQEYLHPQDISRRIVPYAYPVTLYWRAQWERFGGKIVDGRMVALRDDPIWEKLSVFGNRLLPFDFDDCDLFLETVDREEARELGLNPPDRPIEHGVPSEDDDLEFDDIPDEIEFEINIPFPVPETPTSNRTPLQR